MTYALAGLAVIALGALASGVLAELAELAVAATIYYWRRQLRP